MVRANPFAATLIERSARGYAAVAASRLLERSPSIAERFAPSAFETWRTHLAHCLLELAAAVSDGEPELFARRIAWSRVAFEARSVPLDDLRVSLQCLREVLEAELPQPAKSDLSGFFDSALAGLDAAETDEGGASELPQDEPFKGIAGAYVAGLAALDRRRACVTVFEAVRDGAVTARDAIEQVVLPVQREMGRLWHLGEISVVEEHFATRTAKRLLVQIAGLAPAAPPVGRTVLVGSVGGDLHDVGPMAVAEFFELDGWRSVFVGADVPSQELASAIAHFDADLVALGATLDTQRRYVTQAIQTVRESGSVVPFMVGGSAFEHGAALWQASGANGYAATPGAAVRLGRELLGLIDR